MLSGSASQNVGSFDCLLNGAVGKSSCRCYVGLVNMRLFLLELTTSQVLVKMPNRPSKERKLSTIELFFTNCHVADHYRFTNHYKVV
jgi:hypothetical protein